MTERQESLAQRLGKFALFVGAIFALMMGVIISQRLSDDALALLVGLGCGVSAMMPMMGLGVLLWRREEKRQRAAPQVSPPQVVVVTPQAMPGYGGSMQPALPAPGYAPGAWGNPGVSERRFTIVGGEE